MTAISCQSCSETERLLKCGACYTVSYCSKECQKADWNAHKVACRSFKSQRKKDLSRPNKITILADGDFSASDNFRQFLSSPKQFIFVSSKRSQTVFSKEAFSEKELDWIECLSKMSEREILDRDKGETVCKKLGQDIFDFYKEISEDSFEAKKQLVKVCEAVTALYPDKRSHSACIERAWNGVGDSNWRWMA